MKKLLLTAAAVSTLAASSAMASQGDFYGTLYGGANKLNDLKGGGEKFKSETAGHIGVGVGYYIDEMFRADLTFDHLFDPDFKYTSKANAAGIYKKIKASGEVNALMINGYADVFDAGMAKFYVGAGIGAARTKIKSTTTTFDSNGTKIGSSSGKSKASTEFAYALHVGASTELTHGIHGFLTYSWKDYGKVAKDDKKNHFRGHHGSVGVRVDF